MLNGARTGIGCTNNKHCWSYGLSFFNIGQPIYKSSWPLQITVLFLYHIGTKMCMDPRVNGAILNVRGEGGPGPPGGGRSEQLVPDSGDG